jgi:chloramphenicol-sensitive protein RarD
MNEVAPVSGNLQQDQGESGRGFAFALSAYMFWGFLPLYMKALAHVSPIEVVVHRILWSVPVAGIILIALGRTSDIKWALRSRRTMAMALLTATLISANWCLYVWSVSNGHAVQTALGYYINPLVNVLLGAVLLGEKLNRSQLAAVSLAVIAVVILTVNAGGLPWISLALAFSFGFYGFFRKTLPIGPSQGFFLEVAVLSIPAFAYALWLGAEGEAHFASTTSDTLLLIGCGPVTAIPLILYAFGAKLLRFTTLGLLQYFAPTMIFLIAVYVFHEPFSKWQAVAFAFIWSALGIYSWSLLSGERKRRRALRST